MMDYPILTPENKSRDFMDVFGGYNHNPRIQDNEFYDMQNMTGSYYPVLATRDKRGNVPAEICNGAGQSANYVRGMLYRTDLYYVVYNYNPTTQTVTVPFALRKYADGIDSEVKAFPSGYMNSHDERKLIMMGAYIIILPDKLYVNLGDTSDFGSIEAEAVTADGEKVKIQPCLADGRPIVIKNVGSTVPQDYSDGYVWVDTSEDVPQVKYYDSENNVWISVISQYIRFSAQSTEISADFNVGDGIKISGVPDEITEESINFNSVSILRLKPDNKSIVLSGSFKSTIQIFTPIIQISSAKYRMFCSRTVVADQYKYKHFIIGGQKLTCSSNSQAVKYKKYVTRNLNVSSAQATHFTTIKKKQTWTPTPQTTLWGTIKVELNTGVGESLFDSVDSEEDIYVRIGNEDTSSRNVFKYRHHSAGSGTLTEDADQISLRYVGGAEDGYIPFCENGTFTIPAGTRIYPINEENPFDQYQMNITFDNDVEFKDKICLDPEYEIECDEPLTLERKMPEMDHIIESKNRLWGCRYGENSDGTFVNEIYASKLGDFKNWQCYNGSSTDSYAATCGSDGAWTGAISYLGYPTFFKENYIHTIYGSYPAQFQINSISARGVQEGSADSLAMVNEVLFYKSALGICAYTGSLPSLISAAMGSIRYHDAIGCSFNGKYFVCMKDDYNATHFFVYSTNTNTWHKEDNLYVDQFCPVLDDIYYISSSGLLKSLFGSGGQDSEDTVWSIVTGIIGLSAIDNKYVSRINIRLSFSEQRPTNFHRVNAYIQYDSSTDENGLPVWENLNAGIMGANAIQKPLQSYTLRIKPKRCDHFRLKLEGAGQVKIYSISKTIEQGSDVQMKSGGVR